MALSTKAIDNGQSFKVHGPWNIFASSSKTRGAFAMNFEFLGWLEINNSAKKGEL